ncbi:flavin-containing monooxygenase [Minwuia thermotolerans]|uniref:Monooxygenase n=1 Tax=Minwuia thermotolerans TaxID=2056226 RepID=A0A2M9G3R8_9PROT|nr:NAD(P)/FAD-dependent oxidoreductase [Minwuia thermotolerans]PJK30369.1 monooxygenase [Minwuia thermotolerans]
MSSSMERNTDEARLFEEAVAVANIPTLLMVLVQLTGELGWLEPRYRPSRGQGLDDNDSGGLPEDVQREIREASLEAILAWRAGKPVALPDPDPKLLVKMLSISMGEPVPEEYGEMTKAQLGLRPVEQEPIEVPEGFRALVIGAGASGMCMGVHLKAAGIPFEMIERNTEVGGVWLENRYPGAGVDTPNHLYSFSFVMWDWSKFFALRDELKAYLNHVADHFGLRDHIRFQTEVVSTEWVEDRQQWKVTTRDPSGREAVEYANIVVSAAGIFNPPVFPDIPGIDDFDGPSFHTSRWPDDLDLKGKRVAIIGNGASAMQICPEIQHDVESLTIYQRSLHWAAPFPHFRKPVPDALRFLIREVPLYQAWYRCRLGWTFNDRVHPALQKDPDWPDQERSLNAINDGHRKYFTKYIRDELGDRQDLLEKVVPPYPPFGKRMLMDNGWFRMLRNPKVELVTERIQKVDGNALVTEDGERREADVLIIATGFDVLRFINTYEARGRDGKSLREVWDDDDARAYMGTLVPGFPNYFILYGPNTQPGHGGSLLFVIEMQINYIMDLIRKMTKQDIGAAEIRKDVHDAYNAHVEKAHENMVWTHPGMQTYYRNDKGRVTVNFPYRNVDLFEMTREAKLDEYETEKRKAG